jgi:ArsR family transcriptional regulator
MTISLPVIQPPDSRIARIREPAQDQRETDGLLVALKALADGSRLAIFQLIAAQDGEICACDIVDRFDLRQPTIAHHLKVLRDAGLITAEKRGVWVHYAVNQRGVARLRGALADITA